MAKSQRGVVMDKLSSSVMCWSALCAFGCREGNFDAQSKETIL